MLPRTSSDGSWVGRTPRDIRYQVFAKTLTGRRMVLDVGPDTTVGELQTLIQNRDGTPPSEQRLVFRGASPDII